MDARIIATATDLFMRDGYNGVSFLTIGRELSITHSNIHYYYKTKAALAEAVVRLYVADMLAAYRAIWEDPGTDLFLKFVRTRDWAQSRYLAYNPTGSGAAHWGLLHRFTHDSGSLSPEIKVLLRDTTRHLDGLIRHGVELAVRAGDLAAATPTDDIVLQISTMLYSSRQVTRYEGRFDRLDRLFRSTFSLIHGAFGSGFTPAWPALPKAPPTPIGRARNAAS